MELLQVFPHVNAGLNALSACFLTAGFFFIMKRKVGAHRVCMLAASTVSAVFLIGYVTHHAIRTYLYGLGPTRFAGDGVARPIYFTILTSHTILAAVIGPFVIVTLRRGLKGWYESHRKLARLVFPIWLYVSATGVVVYMMLYHLYPAR